MNEAGRINLPDFRLYYKATVIKAACTGTKTEIQTNGTKQKDQKSPCTYGQFIFDRGGKNIQWGKNNIFNKWCWENWAVNVKEWNQNTF